MSNTKHPEVHIAYGQRLAHHMVATKRCYSAETHFGESEIATVAAIGYMDGLRDSGRDELLAALRALTDDVLARAYSLDSSTLAALSCAQDAIAKATGKQS